jgi:hypothetical protein
MRLPARCGIFISTEKYSLIQTWILRVGNTRNTHVQMLPYLLIVMCAPCVIPIVAGPPCGMLPIETSTCLRFMCLICSIFNDTLTDSDHVVSNYR